MWSIAARVPFEFRLTGMAQVPRWSAAGSGDRAAARPGEARNRPARQDDADPLPWHWLDADAARQAAWSLPDDHQAAVPLDDDTQGGLAAERSHLTAGPCQSETWRGDAASLDLNVTMPPADNDDLPRPVNPDGHDLAGREWRAAWPGNGAAEPCRPWGRRPEHPARAAGRLRPSRPGVDHPRGRPGA